MELAAVLISVVSLAFAGLSWRASKRSADAAEASAQEAAEMAEIEKARHRHENNPTFDLTGKGAMKADLVTFTLTVTGPQPSYRVEMEAIEGSYVEVLRLTADGATSTPVVSLDEVKQGVPVHFYGDKRPDSQQHQRFRLRFSDGIDDWSLYAECKIQWPPMVHVIQH